MVSAACRTAATRCLRYLTPHPSGRGCIPCAAQDSAEAMVERPVLDPRAAPGLRPACAAHAGAAVQPGLGGTCMRVAETGGTGSVARVCPLLLWSRRSTGG